MNIVAADIDQDGDLDLLSSTSTYTPLVWLENTDGRGTFSVQHSISRSSSSYSQSMSTTSAILADLSGDDRLDVVVTAGFSYNLVWSKGDGDTGEFSTTMNDMRDNFGGGVMVCRSRC